MIARILNRRGRRLAFCVVATAITAVSIALTPRPADAATMRTATLPLQTAADVVATADRVFVSGGITAEEVVVTDAAGTVVSTLTGLPGPSDLLLSEDRRTLYIALPNINTVAAFDTASLQEVARYPTGGGTCPRALAQTGRWLWFGYACDRHNWGGNVGSIDLGTEPATIRTELVAEVFHGSPLLDTPAGVPGILVAGQPGLSPASMRVLQINADGTLTQVRRTAHTAMGSMLNDLAVTADGSAAFTACGFPYAIVSFGVADLTQQMSLPMDRSPNAVELSPDNALVAGGSDALYDKDVFVYRSNGTRVASVELWSNLIAGGLAWSPDSQRLYAVTAKPGSNPPVPAKLHILHV